MQLARYLLAATTVLLAGCGSTAATDPGLDPTPEGAVQHPLSAVDPVLRIDVSGGFVPTTFALSDLAEITITGDGTVYLADQGSAGLVRPVWTAHLDEASLQEILGLADRAGLLNDSGDHPPRDDVMIADAPTTSVRFVIGDGSRIVEHTAYALGIDEDAHGARAALAAFVDDVEDLVADLPTESLEPTALVVHAMSTKGGGHVYQPDDLEGVELTEGCQVVEDPAAIAELTGDTPDTSSGDQAWLIAARVLLPGDAGCQDPRHV